MSDCSECLSNGNVFSCQCFHDTSATAGAYTLSRLYALEGNGQLDASTTNGIISNVVAYGYTVATLTCQQAFVNQQILDLECNNPAGALVGSNPNCLRCKELAAQVAADRQQLEQEASARNPNYQPQKVNEQIAESYFGISGDHADGICKYVCEQCVFENLSQNIQMQMVAECDINTKTFTSAFTQGMSVQAEVALTQHQEALKTTGLDLKSQEDIKSLSIEMANTIYQMTTIKMLNAMKQNAFNVQQMTVNPNSTSVMVQNGSQGITTSMLASMISRVYNNTSVQNSINYQDKSVSIQIETSFTDLVNSLQTTVDTIETLLINTIGKVMITLLAMIMLILMVFAALFFFRPGFLFGGALDTEDAEDLPDLDAETEALSQYVLQQQRPNASLSRASPLA